MIFTLACGDVMPGCTATFRHSSQDGLLGEVAQHAAAAHGITQITPDVLAAVTGQIHHVRA